MPQGLGLTDDQLKAYYDRPDFDPADLSPEEKSRLVRLTEPDMQMAGTHDVGMAGVGAQPPATPAPSSGVGEFLGGMGSQYKDMFGGLVDAARAIPDVVSNTFSGDPSVRNATASGFAEGGMSGLRGFKSLITDPIAAISGAAPPPEGESTARRTGRLAAVGSTALVPAAVKGARALTRPRTGGVLRGADMHQDILNRQSKGAPYDVPRPTPDSLNVTRTPYLSDRFTAEARAVGPDSTGTPLEMARRVQTSGLGETGPGITVTSPDTPVPYRAAGEFDPDMFQETPVAASPETSGAPPAAQGPPPVAHVIGEGSDTPPTLSELRSSVGADAAAADPRVQEVASELGMPIGQREVQDMTGGPSRWPHTKEVSELEQMFQRLINDERGMVGQDIGDWRQQLGGTDVPGGKVRKPIFRKQEDIDRVVEPMSEPLPDLQTQQKLDSYFSDFARRLKGDETGALNTDMIRDVGRGLNQLRVASFLSGWALPKSVLGNVGSIGTSALETGSMAPIREAFDIPTNMGVFKNAWRASANPAGITGSGILNPVGRLMGAMDETTTQALQRGGLPLDEARRLLLTRPKPLGDSNLGHMMESPVGKTLWPFQRTPFNGIIEGLSSENWSTPTRSVMTATAGGAGAVAGSETNDPVKLALMAALMGPRGVPFLIGAGFGGAGTKAVGGVSPIPEWSIPSEWNDLNRFTGLEPAAIRAFGLDEPGQPRGRQRRTTRRKRKESR
jgi:hypothetical protein